MTKFDRRPARVMMLLAASTLALAACNPGGAQNTTGNALADAAPPLAALPLAMSATTPSAPAPAASALPPARPARLGRIPVGDRYAYLNRAYGFSQTLADAPPDYTYDYRGERPLVWQSNDGYERVAEQLPQGVRYFYYAPGASEPYFVQDPQYGYGYSDGQLTVVYGPDGQALADEAAAQQAAQAGQYLAWAAGLYAASRHDRHEAVAAERWQAERQVVYADQARWQAYRNQNDDWRNYAQAHDPDDQGHWAAERMARASEAARYAQSVNDAQALARAQQAGADARAMAEGSGRPDRGRQDFGVPQQAGQGERHDGPGAAPVAAGVAGAAALGAAAFAAHHQAQVNAQAAQQVQAARAVQTQAQAQAQNRGQAEAEVRARQAQTDAQARTVQAQNEAQARALQARGQAQMEAQAQARAHQADAERQAQAQGAARMQQAHAVQAEAMQARAQQAQAQAAQAHQAQAAAAQQQAERAQAARSEAQAQGQARAQAQAAQAEAQARAAQAQHMAEAHASEARAAPAQPAPHAPPPPAAKPPAHTEAPRDIRPGDRKPN